MPRLALMIFKLLPVLALSFLAGFAPPASAQSPDFAEIERHAAALPRLTSVVVLQDGETVYERGPVARPANIKSASKTVVSALVGIAIDKGVLESADQKIAPLLKASLPADPDPRLNDITIGDLLTMRAGLERTSGANYGSWVQSRDWVRNALARPFVDEPGGRMLYSTGSTHLLSAVLTKAAGRPTLELAREWLADPLGIKIPSWDRDPQGIYFGGNNMAMTPRAMAAFGELYRNGGMADGRRIVSKAWIDASWTPVTESFFTGHGYGYGWFATNLAGQDVRYAWGHAGQFIFVVPSARLTVAMTSAAEGYKRGSDHVEKLHALMADVIIPAAMSRQSPAH